MLLGRSVRTKDFNRIYIFHPDLRRVDDIPLYGDGYLITVDVPQSVMDERFPRSVSLSKSGYVLDDRKNALEKLKEIITVPASHEKLLDSLSEHDFWTSLPVYILLKKFPPEIEWERSGVFFIFKAVVQQNRKELINLFFNSNLPIPVLFSSMLTFIQKAKNINSMTIKSRHYRKYLYYLSHRMPKIVNAIKIYLGSQRGRSDFLLFLLELL